MENRIKGKEKEQWPTGGNFCNPGRWMRVAPTRWKQMKPGKKQMISRYILRVKLTGFADKLKEWDEIRRVHNDL